MTTRMETIDATPVNRTRLDQAHRAWAELLAEALRRGFYGTAALELTVQDGTIQHVRRKVDRMER
jgi:hypothetical protein